jgi:putative Flp pilus-assembly TadE/G-like protein
MSRLRHEAGQTVVLFAVLLPLFLGLGAIAVDIGYWYVVKKTAQDAADAAALAAAAELPDKFAAEQAAATYVEANMPDASWQVEYPYVPELPVGGGDPAGVGQPPPPPLEGAPDPTKVEVIVEQHVKSLFGRAFGFFDADVASRAVAVRLNSDGNVAIFTTSVECGTDDLTFNGNNTSINGYVHANGRFVITSDPILPRWWAADGSRVDCGASVNPHASARFGGTGYDDPVAETLPRELPAARGWPMWVTPGQLGVSWPSCPDEWTWETSHAEIPSGVYCARREIRIAADDVTGRVTLVAPSITVDGDGQDLAPFARRILFFAPPNITTTAADDGPVAYDCSIPPTPHIELGGERYSWVGTIFNPCGSVHVSVGEARNGLPQITGTILSYQLAIDGDNLTMIGRSNFDVNAEVALAE